MKRNILAYALLAIASAALAAQQSSQAGPYTGTSNPPPDTSIVTDEVLQDSPGKPPAGMTGYEQSAPIPVPKPSPAKPAAAPAATRIDELAPLPSAAVSSPTSDAATDPADGTDAGIVIVAPRTASEPELNQRDGAMGVPSMNDADGDIVHPETQSQGGAAYGAMRGTGYGATIRVRLLDGLSTASSLPGERFRTRVASDVIQDGQVLIPAGAEIDGEVVGVSSGHAFGGGGSMHLRPETVILADGSQYRIYAVLSGAPGSTARINGEGGVSAGPELKRDGIEYGGAVGAGAVTGAILGGPGGAVAGTLIGAGVITVHLLVSHPQARLESGTVLLFTLNQPLNLVPAAQPGN